MNIKERFFAVVGITLITLGSLPAFAQIDLSIFKLGTKGIEVKTPAMPAHPGIASLRNVAVFDFTGEEGKTFANALRDSLQAATIRGTRIFTLNSDALMLVEGQRRLDDMVRLGKAKGLDALYYGVVEKADVQADSKTEKKCKKKDFGGVLNFCKSKEKSTVYCRTLTATYRVSIKVIDIGSGTEPYIQQKQAIEDDKTCQDDIAILTDDKSGEELLTSAREAVLAQFQEDILLRTVTSTVKVKSRLRGIDKETRDKFKNAYEFAKDGRLDRACGSWEVLLEDHPENSDMLYNLGVCAEAQGDFHLASERYRAADDAVTKSDKDINAALERIDEAIRAIDYLKSLENGGT